MPAAPFPADELARLDALKALQLLDTRREPVFDRITELARDISGADVAAISLVHTDRQWFKAINGLDIQETPRDIAFCAHTILQRGVLWVEDALTDARFVDNPLVLSGQIRFYAGAPLVTGEGLAVGALCLFSSEPRAFQPDTARRLGKAAALVMDAVAQRQARLRSENQIARDTVRKAPTSISMLDRDLRFVMVSERMEAESGLTEDQVKGRLVFDVSPGMRAVESRLRRALEGETLSGKQAPLTRRDGEIAVCDWEFAPWRGPDGEIAGVRVMTFDLTELVRSREAVSKSEERLKLAVKVAETLVWELDFKTGKVESVGEASRFVEQELVYADFIQDLLNVVHRDDLAKVSAAWEATIDLGRPFEMEYRMKRASGEDFWVVSTARVFHDRKGRPERIIGALRDITRPKQHMLALERARAEAEAANRAKSEFLANMSHEIRTPLNGVMGVAGALERTDLGPQQREMVRLIESSAQTLERLLSDVLDLARVESGRLDLRSERFSVGEVVASAAALFARQAQAKGIGFHYKQPCGLDGDYAGDPVRLRQVLSNLLSNAVKFTRAGRVTFSAEREELGTEHRLSFRIDDTGVGFDADASERLFRRFEQADGSITREFGGTGLGLAISGAIVEAMGGTIQAASTPNVGSSFIVEITLPVLERPRVVTTGGAPSEGPDDARPLRVLLAEDHEVNRKVVSLILQSAQVELVTVFDGAQAVEAFRDQGAFDLVLMDMQMPVMDGLSATRAIRAWEVETRSAPTPIVALTANAMPEHVQASLDAGADRHLSKPISAKSLLGLLAEVAAAAEPEPLALSA